MFVGKVVINNESGLHARPASMLMELAGKFKSEITLSYDDVEINPKSIISILSGGVYKGTELEVKIVGEDEDEASKSIMELLENLPD